MTLEKSLGPSFRTTRSIPDKNSFTWLVDSTVEISLKEWTGGPSRQSLDQLASTILLLLRSNNLRLCLSRLPKPWWFKNCSSRRRSWITTRRTLRIVATSHCATASTKFKMQYTSSSNSKFNRLPPSHSLLALTRGTIALILASATPPWSRKSLIKENEVDKTI